MTKKRERNSGIEESSQVATNGSNDLSIQAAENYKLLISASGSSEGHGGLNIVNYNIMLSVERGMASPSFCQIYAVRGKFSESFLWRSREEVSNQVS